MNRYTFFIWQPYICPHVIPWVEGLLNDERTKEVFYIIPHMMDNNRKDFGWDGKDIINNEKIRLIIRPNDQKLDELYHIDVSNAIHIYHGMVCFKPMDHYFKYGLKYSLRRFLTTEPPYIYNKPLWSHYIKFLIRDYKYAQYIERVFAIGGKLCENFYKKTYKWNITPFIYVTKEPTLQELPQRRKDNNFFNIVYVGNISKRKNVGKLIEALDDIKLGTITLDIIGNGERMNEIKTMIQKRDLKNIQLLGNKNLPEIYMTLKNYDAIILPSLHDGWGAVINEGLMRGCFVIVSNHCGAKEIITNERLGYIFSLEKNNLKETLYKCINNINSIKDSFNYRIEWSKRIEGNVIAKYLIDSIENKNPPMPWKE